MGAALSCDVVMPPDSVCLSALFLVRPGAAQMHQYFITLAFAILIFVPPFQSEALEEIFSSFLSVV